MHSFRRTVTLALLSCVVWCAPAAAQQDATGPPAEAVVPLPPVERAVEEIPPLNLGPEFSPAAEEVQPLPIEGGASPADSERGAADFPLLLAPSPSMFELCKLWESSFELGLTGSLGNANTQTWQGGFHTKRETPWLKLTVDANYKKAYQANTVIADRLFFEYRAERPFQQSPWSAYLHGTVEFDDFRAYDVRVTDDIGLGYAWYQNDRGFLKTRLGAGVSREIGGPDDRYVPEAVTGFDFERKLSKRQKLNLSAEYFFDWTDFNENRSNAKANWEVILDQESQLSLKIGAINRYDSTPNGAEPNDLDYSAVLLWNF